MSFKKEALGSVLEIDLGTNLNKNNIIEINNIVDSFENKYSRFKKNNFLDILNKSGISQIDEEFKTIFSLCGILYKTTNGYFDITTASLLENMGYGIKVFKIEENLGFDKIKLKQNTINLNGTRIEFGSVGKGYLIDKIYEYLKEYQNDIIINFGGDIRIGNKEKTIGLEDPYDEKKIIGEIKIKNKAFGSSSGQKRKFGKSHHLINPKNKQSQNDKIAIYLTHKYASFADGFSTALFVTPLEKSIQIIEKIDGLEGLIIAGNGEMYKSRGFEVKLF